MAKLSEHFDESEFACPHCGVAKVDPRLVDALEVLRTLAGAPVRINSGYRCPDHNKAVGGAPKSQHAEGTAADIRIAGKGVLESFELALMVKDFREGGIGLYDTGFLHVDVRNGRARWARIDGKYQPQDKLLRLR